MLNRKKLVALMLRVFSAGTPVGLTPEHGYKYSALTRNYSELGPVLGGRRTEPHQGCGGE